MEIQEWDPHGWKKQSTLKQVSKWHVKRGIQMDPHREYPIWESLSHFNFLKSFFNSCWKQPSCWCWRCSLSLSLNPWDNGGGGHGTLPHAISIPIQITVRSSTYKRGEREMGQRLEKLRRMVRQQKGKLYIMRTCISMLICWHKYAWSFARSIGLIHPCMCFSFSRIFFGFLLCIAHALSISLFYM